MSDPRPQATVIRALIVDDEPLAREGIALLLADDREIEVVGTCGNGVDALRAIRDLSPDLLFLDIQMPELNGFEVVAQLDLQRSPAIIFVTAYDQYALRAFEIHALDYLLKPFSDERFYAALSRAKEHIRLTQVSAMSERLMSLLSAYQASQEPTAHREAGRPTARETRPTADKRPDSDRDGDRHSGQKSRRLAVKSTGRVVFVDVADIDWIEAADYYVQLHVGPETHLHRQTMASLERELDSDMFLRIHRSAIVNRQRIREIRHQGKRDLVVVLDTGVELKVARRHRDKLQALTQS